MQPEDAWFFDPTTDISFIDRKLPHWDQPGTFAFITFRLGDSIPAELVARFRNHRASLLREAGMDPSSEGWKSQIDKLPVRQASVLRWKLFTAWDQNLDESRGACHLRRRDASKMVADGLLKFDRDRYLMAAFVVMPNHVHLLAAFAVEGDMTSQGASWRKYFARKINSLIGRKGHLWQGDQFDHLVRSEASFDRIRQYILNNPAQAKLPCGEYRLYASSDW